MNTSSRPYYLSKDKISWKDISGWTKRRQAYIRSNTFLKANTVGDNIIQQKDYSRYTKPGRINIMLTYIVVQWSGLRSFCRTGGGCQERLRLPFKY